VNPNPARLWHFTCSHSVDGIHADGELRPHQHPWMPEPLVWLTDLEVPFRDALGLTSHTLGCDRTEHRFEVADPTAAVWWPTYARTVRLATGQRLALEQAPGAMPAHWWVSAEPIPVRIRRAA
jgi:hypothetical protein